MLKRIKNHSKVRSAGCQELLALPLLLLTLGGSCACLFIDGRFSAVPAQHIEPKCLFVSKRPPYSLLQMGDQILSWLCVRPCRCNLHFARRKAHTFN